MFYFPFHYLIKKKERKKEQKERKKEKKREKKKKRKSLIKHHLLLGILFLSFIPSFFIIYLIFI